MNLMLLIFGAALKGTLVLTAAAVAVTVLRRESPDLRFRIWLAALVTLLLLLIPLPTPFIGSFRLSASVSALANPGAGVSASREWQTWILGGWIIGFLFIALKAVLGMIRLMMLTRGARRDTRNVYWTGETKTPLTWGFFRPVILLPDYASEWTDGQRDRAIRHEQAHIAHHDWVWHLFAQAVTAIFWFHPLVWLAASSLRREAELAADDAVLAAGTDAATYAAQLVEVARMFQGRHYAAGVNMIRSSMIEGRIQSILNPARVRKPAGFVARAGIVIAALAFLLPLAAYQAEPLHKISEPGVKAPTILSKIDPDYTQKAKDEHVEGKVVLTLVVGSNGQPHDIVVAQSLYPGLDENAVDALSQWKFKPAEKDGKPVAVQATIEVNFKLK